MRRAKGQSLRVLGTGNFSGPTYDTMACPASGKGAVLLLGGVTAGSKRRGQDHDAGAGRLSGGIAEGAFLSGLKSAGLRFAFFAGVGLVVLIVVLMSCTARVLPNELGVMQNQLGGKVGIEDRIYGAGLYFTRPGSTLHTFSREIHELEASYDREESLKKAQDGRAARR